MGLEDIKGLEKLESDVAWRPNRNSEYTEKGTIYAIDDCLYMKVYDTGTMVDICTNVRNKSSYWSLKQLQERISAVLEGKEVDFDPVSVTEFLDGGSRGNAYSRLDSEQKIQISLLSPDKVKLVSQDSQNSLEKLTIASGIGLSVISGLGALALGYLDIGIGIAGLGIIGSVMVYKVVEPIADVLNSAITKSSTKYIQQLKQLNRDMITCQRIIDNSDNYTHNFVIKYEKKKHKLETARKELANKLAKVHSALRITYAGNRSEVESFLESILKKKEPEEQQQNDVSEKIAETQEKTEQAEALLDEKLKEKERKRWLLEEEIAILKEKYIDLPITIRKEKLQEPEGLERIGKKVNGKYEIMEYLGGGLNGDVYKARLLGTEDEHVAIKFTKDEDTFNLLHKLRNLKDKSVVDITDWNFDEGFIVFQYKPCNLRDVLNELKKTDKILPVEVANDIIYKVIQAIYCAHENGIIHKDIKPENILLDEQGNVAVSDFGLAREVVPDDLNSLRSVRGFEGTIQYSAPEQEEDPTKATTKTDAYQIGLIFNELLFKTRRIAPEVPHNQRIDIDKETTERILRTLLVTEEYARAAPENIVRSLHAQNLQTKPLELKIIKEEPAEQEPKQDEAVQEEPVAESVEKEPAPAPVEPITKPEPVAEKKPETDLFGDPIPKSPEPVSIEEPAKPESEPVPDPTEIPPLPETYIPEPATEEEPASAQVPVPADTEEVDEDEEEEEEDVILE